MNKSLSFWSDFRPHTIGFDTIFDNLDYLRTVPNNNYPPYNIRKIDDEHWSIDVALAGFSKDDIEVEHKPDENLSYEGLDNDEFLNYIYKKLDDLELLDKLN